MKKPWEGLGMSKKEFMKVINISKDDEAKALVAYCFRNNPRLEELHCENKISQEDMKTMMKYAVNQMYYFLWLRDESNMFYQAVMRFNHLFFTTKWDDPDIDIEERRLMDIEALEYSHVLFNQNGINEK
jgi:hypothetical protein